MRNPRYLLFASIVIFIIAFFLLDLQRFFTLDWLKAQQLAIESYREAHPQLSVIIYMLIYIAITGLSLPGAAVLTLVGGAVFGLLWGTLIVSFASTIGATLAFLAARFLFRDIVEKRVGPRLETINTGIAKEGTFYLFALRLVPLFPFFVINLVMGLTKMYVGTFFWVSQVGMLAGTLVYVNAGEQLAQLDSVAGVLSPTLVGSFILLGLFPLMAKKALAVIKNNKA